MTSSSKTPDWLVTAITIYNFHARRCQLDDKWQQRDTAIALSRSLGSVNQYMTLASWAKTHRTQMEKLLYMNDAIAWVRERQKVLDQRELDV